MIETSKSSNRLPQGESGSEFQRAVADVPANFETPVSGLGLQDLRAVPTRCFCKEHQETQNGYAPIPVKKTSLFFTVDDSQGRTISLRSRLSGQPARQWTVGDLPEGAEQLRLDGVAVDVFHRGSFISFEFNRHPILSRIPLLGWISDPAHHISFSISDTPENSLVMSEKDSFPWLVRKGYPVGMSKALADEPNGKKRKA